MTKLYSLYQNIRFSSSGMRFVYFYSKSKRIRYCKRILLIIIPLSLLIRSCYNNTVKETSITSVINKKNYDIDVENWVETHFICKDDVYTTYIIVSDADTFQLVIKGLRLPSNISFNFRELTPPIGDTLYEYYIPIIYDSLFVFETNSISEKYIYNEEIIKCFDANNQMINETLKEMLEFFVTASPKEPLKQKNEYSDSNTACVKGGYFAYQYNAKSKDIKLVSTPFKDSKDDKYPNYTFFSNEKFRKPIK